ncbi:hypothetical protein [Bacillus sp. ISL-75]|uniref:hypothetical protein n=1 Tax=Bacillus sp. ISL-75 TaxID=2819137 RepID=UPI001BE9A4A8|nr:hypothetical protein [Bacillus sp. ISL-75]
MNPRRDLSIILLMKDKTLEPEERFVHHPLIKDKTLEPEATFVHHPAYEGQNS